MTNIPVLYAFVCTAEGQGIVAEIVPGLGTTQLITGSEVAMAHMRELAQKVARKSGLTIELRKYTAYEVVETF